MPSIIAVLRVAACLALVVAAGCSGSDAPPVAPVEGVVTLGGQPLENALVTFTPKAGGRPSIGRTDSDGAYELVYSRQENGAVPGDHTVEISTWQQGDASSNTEGTPEKVPAKYNVKTELTETVDDDDNVIDFDLEAEGEIIDPATLDRGN